jgi:dihydroorotase
VKLVLKNFRIVDEARDIRGAVLVEDGLIREIIKDGADFPGTVPGDTRLSSAVLGADLVMDGQGRVLMPAFVELHAHFRDPGFPEKETLESASLAAVAGGYGTLVCMANTRPVIDNPEAAAALKARSDALGLIDLYPALALTRAMEGRELSGITAIDTAAYRPRLLSEDGKDVACEALFLAAMEEARRLGIPVSCHCDFGGEERSAVYRALRLGEQAGCRIHIAHISTAESAALVRAAKQGAKQSAKQSAQTPGGKAAGTLTCEATPHHLALTAAGARYLGAGGGVNPPLGSEADRRALVEALLDGTVDAIATDHAPHTAADKAAGAPGFVGLETAFGVCYTELVAPGRIGLCRLSALMSANPARILGLGDRGRIEPGLRADLVMADPGAAWTVDSSRFRSRGQNTPFQGRTLCGKILATLHGGRVVYV